MLEFSNLLSTRRVPEPYGPIFASGKELPAGTVDTLLQPENKGQLTSILTYHAVAGRVPASALAQAITDAGGTYEFQTLAGNTLSASFDGQTIVVTDEAGRTTNVVKADVNTSNGVIHVTDGVFLPG